MKIYELIKCINATTTVSAKHNGSEIVFYGPGEHLYATDYFLSVPVDARVWDTIEFYPDNLDDVIPQDLARTMDFVQRLIDTPIKERYPEKKYRLMAMRYVEGPVATKQYVSSVAVGGDYANFNFGFKEDAEEWTDANLHYLSQFFPKEAIEAMKEQVEDD